jgi:hypothetical protein
VFGTAQATLTVEKGNGQRVDVTTVDDLHWHARLSQVLEDLQEGATYIVRFRAKANVRRPIELYAQIEEPDWHDIGLNQAIAVTENWGKYEVEFQAKNLGPTNLIRFLLGDQTGTVWINDVTITKQSLADRQVNDRAP